MESNTNKHTTVSEDALVAISYGALLTLIIALSSIFIWVGYIQNSLANTDKEQDKTSQKTEKIKDNIDNVAGTIHSIDSRLSRIEGILEELRRK